MCLVEYQWQNDETQWLECEGECAKGWRYRPRICIATDGSDVPTNKLCGEDHNKAQNIGLIREKCDTGNICTRNIAFMRSIQEKACDQLKKFQFPPNMF